MLSEETKNRIEREAWKAWEEDQKTNPTKVNPHAFVYGYKIAAERSEKLLEALKEIILEDAADDKICFIAKQAIENHNKP